MKDVLTNEINKIINANGINDVNNNKEFLWSLISTTILLNEKNYDYNEDIDVYFKSAIDEIIETQEMKHNKFLDDKGNEVGNFSDILTNNTLKNAAMYEENLDDYEYDLFKEIYSLEIPVDTGCNKLIMTNGNLDISKLVTHVRNAFAHSSYEVIDEGRIRLYSINKGKYDLNIEISNLLAVAIIDEVNKKTINKYVKYIDLYDNEETKNEVVDIKEAEMLLSEYHCFTDDEIKGFINRNTFEGKCHFNGAINEINDKLNSVCGPALALDYFIYNKYKNVNEYDDYLYNRYGQYQFYNRPLEEMNEVRKNEILFKLLFSSLINEEIVRGYNTNQNDIDNMDLSKMFLDVSSKDRLKNKYEQLLKQREKEFNSKHKKIEIQEKKIDTLQKQLKDNKDKDTKYFKETLPKNIENEKNNLKVQMENLKPVLSEVKKLHVIIACIDNNDLNICKKDILNHIRNAIAHGNIYFQDFDINHLENTYIVFKDYDEKKKEDSFYATIALKDMMDLVMKKEDIKTR